MISVPNFKKDIIQSPIHSFIHLKINFFPFLRVLSSDTIDRSTLSTAKQSLGTITLRAFDKRMCLLRSREITLPEYFQFILFLFAKEWPVKAMKPKYWATLKLIMFTLHNWLEESIATAEIQIYRDRIIASIYSFHTTEERLRERKKNCDRTHCVLRSFILFFSSSRVVPRMTFLLSLHLI